MAATGIILVDMTGRCYWLTAGKQLKQNEKIYLIYHINADVIKQMASIPPDGTIFKIEVK